MNVQFRSKPTQRDYLWITKDWFYFLHCHLSDLTYINPG